jgi:hypothetical protein
VIVGEIPPRELARRFGSDGLALHTGPFVTRVRTALPDLVAALAYLYADFSVAADHEVADFRVTVKEPWWRRWWRPQAVLLEDDRMLFLPLPRRLALPMFEWGLNLCISGAAHEYLVVHAAAVERGGRAVIMPGPPGSGKSTLCAALISRGWRLLTDELTLLRPDSTDIAALPRPVGLKNESIDVIRTFVPGAPIGPIALQTVKGTVGHLRPPRESVRRAGEAASPRAVVFPTYSAHAAVSLAPLRKAETLFRLAKSSFNHNAQGVRGFELLANVIDTSACFELTYGDLGGAVAALDTV